MLSTLENLFKLARERKEKPVDGSYTNKLLSDKSLSKSKVIEEINELIEAVDKDTNKIPTTRLIHCCHLFYRSWQIIVNACQVGPRHI